MSKFMKMLNNISRSQAVYRSNKISVSSLQSGHYAFILSICREPARSQEDLAKELCVNKSTVARNLNYLEEKGFVFREPLKNDKRQFSVFPTEKAKNILPEIKKASADWMTLLSENISEEDLSVFTSVLIQMEAKARKIIESQEENQ